MRGESAQQLASNVYTSNVLLIIYMMGVWRTAQQVQQKGRKEVQE